MPKQPTHDPSYLDEDHQRIVEFGHTYFDDDEERDAFIDTLMERRGYVRQNTWAPPPAPDPAQPPAGNGQPPAPQRPAYFKR